MNKVTVLTAGYVQAIEGRQLIPGASDNGARRVASTVTLIQSDHAIVMADPGMVTDRALILNPLKTVGISPQDVTHIFISHHHPDHTVNIALFPKRGVAVGGSLIRRPVRPTFCPREKRHRRSLAADNIRRRTCDASTSSRGNASATTVAL
jgi:glyoxylase-like metal-dependent hydrolase (beta-lactamase superfamily II)